MSRTVLSKKKLSEKEKVIREINNFLWEIIEPYFPGGFFRWTSYAKKVLNNFYNNAKKYIITFLPKKLYKRLRPHFPHLLEDTIDIGEDYINRIILDSIVELHENPDKVKKLLSESYVQKFDDEIFFVPRIEAEDLDRVRAYDPDAKVGDIDRRIIDAFKDISEIKWEWVGIDENGFLQFKLPTLTGNKVFRAKLPPNITSIKSGTYTFKVKEVIPNKGVRLQLKEQSEGVKENVLKNIEKQGLGEDQLNKFFTKIISSELSKIDTMPIEKLIEELSGNVYIEDIPIEEVSELGQYGEVKKKKREKKVREKVRKEYLEHLEEEKKKIQQMINTWTKIPAVARFFLRSSDDVDHINKIAKAIAKKFPERIEKKTLSLAGIISTAPIVEIAVKYMMSSSVPVTTAKIAPWMHLTIDAIKGLALKNPIIKEDIIELMKKEMKKKKDEKEEEKTITDKDILKYLSDNEKYIIPVLSRLKDKIAQIIEEAEKKQDIPELKKFFELRKIFKSYADKVLEADVDEFIEKNNLSIDDPKDREKINQFIKLKTNILADVMKGIRHPAALYKEPVEKLSSETINLLIRHCMTKIKKLGVL